MAQYRAIFQNAYFKGLAAAAVVTMGLAAGQAQATSLEDISTIVDDTPITVPGTYDKIAITQEKTSSAAFTLTITGDSTTNTNTITGVTTTASNATVIIDGDNKTKLEVKGNGTAAGKLIVKDLQVKAGNLALTKDTNAATVEAGTITVGKETTSGNPVTIADGDPTAVISVAAGSTLGKATTAYTLYKGGQITLAGDGAKLLGKSLKAKGGKIINKGANDFTLVSYYENDAEKTAQDLDLDVADGKTLSVKLAGQAPDNRGVLHFGDGSVINLQTGAVSGGILAITSGTGNSGSVVIFDEGVTLTSKGDAANGGSLTIIGQGATSLAELQTDADVIGNFLVENDGDKAGGLLLGEHSKLTINNKKVVLGAATTENTDEALNLKIASGDGTSVPTGQLTVSAATTLKADNVAIVNKLGNGTNLAKKLDIVTDKLTLGSADFDASADALGFKSASAESELNFVSKPNTTFKLQDAVSLKNVDDSGNALDGTITGNVNLGKASTNLTITGGNYTYSGDMTIGAATANLEVKADENVSASTLDFNGKLLLDRTAAAKITVSGDTTTEGSGVTSLDLTDATIEFTGDADSKTITVEALDNATVKVKSDQLDPLFFTDTTKGVLFDVNGGELVIEGSSETFRKFLYRPNIV